MTVNRLSLIARTIKCTTCRGGGKTESDDSTDERIYKCWACDGSGKIAGRRAPDPQLAGAVEALDEIAAIIANRQQPPSASKLAMIERVLATVPRGQ